MEDVEEPMIHRQRGVSSCSLCSLLSNLGLMELNAELKSTNNVQVTEAGDSEGGADGD